MKTFSMNTYKEQVAEIATLVMRDRSHFYGTRKQAIQYAIDGIEMEANFGSFQWTNQVQSIPEITPQEVEAVIKKHYRIVE